MRYVIALIIPPLGPLLCGRLISTVVNLMLCTAAAFIGLATGGMGLLLALVPIIHAWAVIHQHEADRREERMMSNRRW